MKRLILIALGLILLFTFMVTMAADKKKEIAITFNDLPAAEGFQSADRDAISYLILQTLKKHEVKTVGFVVGEQIEESFDILGEWLNEGHALGNMTYSKQDYHQISIEQFITDIRTGGEALDVMLEGFGQKKRYFRFPYNHYGDTEQKKRQAELFLDAHTYIITHLTVLVDDYLYNLSMEKLGKEPDSASYDALLNEYVNHVLDQIEASEMISQQLFKRNCRQILQLSANRLNAVYLDEMLGAIEEMGYTFITVDKALQDQIYQQPEAYFGSRGVNYLEMIMESNPDFIPAE